MKVRATVGFAGPEISMYAGEERDVRKDVAAPLLACGYLVSLEKPKPEKGKKSKTED